MIKMSDNIRKKNILIALTGAMELGGVEKSLLGLLDSFDYDEFEVDLFLYGHHGALYSLINKNVNILRLGRNCHHRIGKTQGLNHIFQH